MIRLCNENDFEEIHAIINDGAKAYKDIIPADRWTDPYMSHEKLRHEMDDGVQFWGFEDAAELEAKLQAVMGLQDVKDVTLIRHAYVRTASQRRGLGAQLLTHLTRQTTTPMLVGTWADATWAIRFYQRYGFSLVSPEEKDRLLKHYWSIPERQVETSVVLADQRWRERP